MMLKNNDIILYNQEKYCIIYVTDTGVCEIQKLSTSPSIELVYLKDIKNCIKIGHK